MRFKLPDPLLNVPQDKRNIPVWGNDDMLQVQGIGAFVRALLRVKLAGGGSVTYGLWLGVHPDELKQLWEIWEKPAYIGHEFQGWCANAVPPWKESLLAAPLMARADKQSELPRVIRSDHEVLARVLEQEWPHDYVLAGLP